MDEVDILIKDLGLDNLSKEDAVNKIMERIKRTRDSYCSSNPKFERGQGVYVELDEIKDMIK